MSLLKEINEKANAVDTAEEIVNEMSMGSDLARRMQGKVSGKQQIRRVALNTLQMVVDGTSMNELEKMFGPNPDAEIYGYLDKLRAQAIEAIKTIKDVEE